MTRNQLGLDAFHHLPWNNWFYGGLGNFLQSSEKGISRQSTGGGRGGRYFKNTNTSGSGAHLAEVIILDVAMPQVNGLDAARNLKHSVPKAKLIFLTMNEDPQLVGEAFRAGPSAFLLKQSAASELTDAVEKVLEGSSYVTPRAAKGQANIILREPQASERSAEPTLR